MKTAPETPKTRFDPARLVAKHQAGVWRYLRALGCSPAEADDFTQETFLSVIEKPFDDYSDPATGAYLRRVAYNRVVTHHRRNGRVSAVENIEEFDATWARWTETGEGNGEELVEHLRVCLGHLTERARQALDMRFRMKQSRVEIAESLGITDHGVKNLMQRAKKQLRICIEGKLQ
jgi:RNA polymerase sigma-70 factor (ECF subfamily)